MAALDIVRRIERIIRNTSKTFEAIRGRLEPFRMSSNPQCVRLIAMIINLFLPNTIG